MNKLKDMSYLAKGKRGVIYTATYKNKKVAIKAKNPDSKASGRIKNEAKHLRLLNRHKIGPKLIKFKDNNLMYEFIEGEFILDFIEKSNKKDILKVIKDLFNQLYILDRLKINKEEMHHPLKHVIIDKKNKPVLIDFERAYKAKKPHNVTQFCQFLINQHKLLDKKGIRLKKEKMIRFARAYKQKQDKQCLSLMLNYILK